MERKRGITVVAITFMALLTALQIILGNVTQLPFLGKQFTFGYLPIAVAGALMGPWAAAVVGALGDFFGAHLFPQGAYFPGFTLTNALVGFAFGLLLYKRKPTWLLVGICVLTMSALNLMLNSLWLSILYASRAYWGWVSVRAVTYLIEAPVQFVLTLLTLTGLERLPLPSELRPEARGRDGRKEQA